MEREWEKPIASQAYDALAERYAKLVDTKPENAYYEMPATLSLLPDVHGKRVLDAGCGSGRYTEWLLQHGAIVTAIDASPTMLLYARARSFGRAIVMQANLGAPLQLADSSFDIVLCPLVLDNLRDWAAVFREFHRLLCPHGCLVFSVGHPYEEFAETSPSGNYFMLEEVEWTWSEFGGAPVTMRAYRRPLQDVLSALDEGGFRLLRLIEPRPIERFRESDPEGYEKLSRRPGFLCISAIRESAADR